MSKRKEVLIGIGLLVLLWCYYNFGLLFFYDELKSEHWRSYFHHSEESYPTMRVVSPLVSGIFTLYLWAKAEHTEKTRILWLGFAFVVFATVIYALATPVEKPVSNKPSIVCNEHGENCHLEPPS